MKKIYWISISLALLCAVLEVVFAIFNLIVPAVITSILIVIFVLIALVIYGGVVLFKCPKCNTLFKGRFWEVFFTPHTPTKRKLRCPVCNEKLWCKDYFQEKQLKSKKK